MPIAGSAAPPRFRTAASPITRPDRGVYDQKDAEGLIRLNALRNPFFIEDVNKSRRLLYTA